MRKSDYFGNLNENNINDNKTFGKTIKPFLLDKVTSTNKLTLIDKKDIFLGDCDTAKVLTTFFSNILSGLNVPEYLNCEPLVNKISDPVFKYVGKYVIKCSNHTRILALGEVCNNHLRLSVSFSKINEAETLKLETAKECQDTNILTKTIKESVEITTDVLLSSLKSNFSSSFRKCKCNTFIEKKRGRNCNNNYRPISTHTNMSKIYNRCIF